MNKKVLYAAVVLALAPLAQARAATPTVPANALPTNGTVVIGTASATLNGDTMTITGGYQGSGDLTAIVWGNQGGATLNPGASGGFNVGSSATVIFKATDVTDNLLNIDTSGNPSVLAGKLELDSNNVLIANGNGIFVGPNADINISGNQYGNGELGLIADTINTSLTNLNAIGTNLFDVLYGYTSNGTLPVASGSVTVASGAFIGNSSGSPYVLIAGSDININGSINVRTVDFLPTGNNSTITIGSTGSVGASDNLSILPGSDDATTQNQYLSIQDNGVMGAQSTMTMGGNGLYIGNITGSGSLAVGSLIINNLVGSINNITSGQILANGFQLSMVSEEGYVLINAVGTSSQGINLKINGNVTLSTGDTSAVLPNGAAPANANSKLIVQASGELTIQNGFNDVQHPNPYNPSDNSFQFPGLIYLESYYGIADSNDDIVNAYTDNAPVGYGVFLIAPQIDEPNPVYANGGRGVVFAAPFNGLYYPTAQVNGGSPNNGMPPVYFLGSSGPMQSQTFTNESGYSQESDTFYTFQPS